MTDMAFTPGVWVTILIDTEGGIVAAFYLDLSGEVVVGDVH